NYWERDDTLLKTYIGNELYEFLKDILVTCFWNGESTKKFVDMKRGLDRLRSLPFKKEIVETTKEDLKNNRIDFDAKWHLFGFDNKVFDLKTLSFRDYKYDDFVSITTGYDWIEPIDEELKKMKDLIEMIHPIADERQLYLEIISTGLEGRCLEKFI